MSTAAGQAPSSDELDNSRVQEAEFHLVEFSFHLFLPSFGSHGKLFPS